VGEEEKGENKADARRRHIGDCSGWQRFKQITSHSLRVIRPTQQ